MLSSLPRFFTRVAQRYLPDAYLFAVLLTFLVFAAGVLFQGSSPLEMMRSWGNGFWSLLEFAMQMALVLVTGFTLAKTAAVSKLLRLIASLAKTNSQAVFIVTLASCIACYINWGFGLVCSALLARELAKSVQKVNYGLLISSAYSGFLVWHGGLSGSIPLKLTAPGPKIQEIIASSSISVKMTLFSRLNLIMVAVTVATLLLINLWMARDKDTIEEVDLYIEHQEQKQVSSDTPAGKLENSKALNLMISLFFLVYGFDYFLSGAGLGLNMVIFIFLGLGIFLHFTPRSFLSAFNDSIRGTSGILLQFPFYAGIMGMMSGSGLAQSLSEFFVSISNESTFNFFTYLSAGIVNFFVPSGGGQWALQGPIILPAAAQLGVNQASAAMAIAWGDAWTNMVQPFWALPLLAAGKCELRVMMGYSAVVFIAIGIVQSALFLFIS